MKKQKEDAEEKCAAIKAQKDELELKILDHKSSVTTSTVQAHGDNNNKATEERINNMTRALVVSFITVFFLRDALPFMKRFFD